VDAAVSPRPLFQDMRDLTSYHVEASKHGRSASAGGILYPQHGRRVKSEAISVLRLDPAEGYSLVTRDDFSGPLDSSFRVFILLLFLPRCESRFQIVMLKCRCHAVDFTLGETMPSAFIAPLRDGRTDVCCHFAGLVNVQFKSRDLHYQYE
jgi:hypothetical protein